MADSERSCWICAGGGAECEVRVRHWQIRFSLPLRRTYELVTRGERTGAFKQLTTDEPQVRMMINQGTTSRHSHQEQEPTHKHTGREHGKPTTKPMNTDSCTVGGSSAHQFFVITLLHAPRLKANPHYLHILLYFHNS